MYVESTACTQEEHPVDQPRVFILADESLISLGLTDLFADVAELRVQNCSSLIGELTDEILAWKPNVILFTSNFPEKVIWEWAGLLKHLGVRLIRVCLQDNSVDLYQVRTWSVRCVDDMRDVVLGSDTFSCW